jgi:hypothetical protein
MRAGVKLAGFAVVLAAAFGVGATMGAAVPEVYDDDERSPGAAEHPGRSGAPTDPGDPGSAGDAEEGDR